MIQRLLPRRLGSALGAITVIGVGVGLAAMVFALADPYAARDLPYSDPGRLVSMEFGLGDPRVALRASQDNVPSLASWQARTDLFEGVAAFDDVGWLGVRLTDRVVPLRGVAVTANLFEVLGLESGRATNDATEAWVSSRAAVTLSRGELSPGRSVPTVPAGTLRVAGILPPSFVLPQANRTEPVDAVVILPPGPVITITGGGRSGLKLVARMRHGVTPEMVEAALGPSIDSVGSSLSVVPLRRAMQAQQQTLARGALFASGLVMLVCWMNVFNLALTRGLYRQRELATRAALGATPFQLVGLMVAEGARVATLGGVSALAVTSFALTSAVSVLPAEFATLGVPSVSTRVIVLIGLAAVVAWLCWSFASLLAWRLDVRRDRRIAGRDGRAIRVMRFGVIAGQVGAASVLLAAAALLGRSYLNLLLIDPGMDEQTQAITVAHDPNLRDSVRFEVVERVVTALRRSEGVQAAGVRRGDILDGRAGGGGVLIEGQFVVWEWTRVDRGFIGAAGFHFLVGGPPEAGQTGAVITERIALKYFPGRSPVGTMLNVCAVSCAAGRTVPIVGVVRDVRTIGLSVAPRLVVYEVGATWPTNQTIFTYVVRFADGSRRLEALQPILSIDPVALVLSDATIGDRLARSVRDRTFATLVVGLFATASLLVTALGLTGVVAYTVVRRTREIAVRSALGATRRRVTWIVARDALIAALSGAIGGVTASVWLSSALESLLYGIRAADPAMHLLAAASLLGIVVAAAVLPALRAGRIAPATALRID